MTRDAGESERAKMSQPDNTLTVRTVPERTCFVSLPRRLVVTLGERQSVIPALRLRWSIAPFGRSSADEVVWKEAYVGWGGGSCSPEVLEISACLAEALGLPRNARVHASARAASERKSSVSERAELQSCHKSATAAPLTGSRAPTSFRARVPIGLQRRRAALITLMRVVFGYSHLRM